MCGGVKPELSKPMTTANCTGNEELDFRLMFGEDAQQQPLGPAGNARGGSTFHSYCMGVTKQIM